MGHDVLRHLAFLGFTVGRGGSLVLSWGAGIRNRGALSATHPEENNEQESNNDADYSARSHEFLLVGADSKVIECP